MVKYKVGGMTTTSGISFIGQKAKVVIRGKDGSFVVRNHNVIGKGKFDNVPFIRGFLKIATMFRLVSGTWFGRICLGIIGFGVLSLILSLFFGETIDVADTETFVNIIMLVLNVTVILGLIIFIFSIRNLHGLEHKLIATYNNELPLTLENVKKQKKETPQCGGTLLGIALFMEIIWIGIFKLPSFFLWFLYPSVGYETFLFANGNKWYNKLLYFPGWLVQQITTGNGSKDETIKKYLEGFTAFIHKEDPEYFERI